MTLKRRLTIATLATALLAFGGIASAGPGRARPLPPGAQSQCAHQLVTARTHYRQLVRQLSQLERQRGPGAARIATQTRQQARQQLRANKRPRRARNLCRQQVRRFDQANATLRSGLRKLSRRRDFRPAPFMRKPRRSTPAPAPRPPRAAPPRAANHPGHASPRFPEAKLYQAPFARSPRTR